MVHGKPFMENLAKNWMSLLGMMFIQVSTDIQPSIFEDTFMADTKGFVSM